MQCVPDAARAAFLDSVGPERRARFYNHGGALGNAWLTLLPQEHGFCISDALFTGALRRRLGLPLSSGPDPAGHAALTRRVGRVGAHHALRDKVIELLGWLGGLRVENLDKPLADLTGTPFAGLHRPDLRAEEAGRPPVYVDVRYSHWWSLGESANAASSRRAAAATPLGAVQTATNQKLR